MNQPPSGDPLPRDRIEVRVLGPLRARRGDGAWVDPKSWQTGQTADLLRLLALHVDEPVPVDVLLDALWPTADEKHGRASLRTAASRIRKALGVDCVERRLGGLVLRDAWVDAHAFQVLAREARRHVQTDAPAEVVMTTREAELLYLAEVRWQTPIRDTVLTVREALAASYQTMLVDAADAAVTLSWWHDALDFAERSIVIEPCSERAYRSLMRAHHGLGEGGRALQAYERCRRSLTQELGADPSSETRALHLQLLSAGHAASPPPAFFGRAAELARLSEALTDGRGRPDVLCVLGAPGSGKSRLVEQATADRDAVLLQVRPGSDPSVGLIQEGARDAVAPGQRQRSVLVVEDAHLVAPEHAAGVAGLIRGLGRQRVVLVTSRPGHESGPAQPFVADLCSDQPPLHLPPLVAEEVSQLCTSLLHGRVCPQLTEAVLQQTGGSPGAVVAVVRRWAGSGRVAATTEGLVVVPAHQSGQLRGQLRRLVADAVERLSGRELEVLHLVAVLDRAVTAELLVPLCGAGPPELSTDQHLVWLKRSLDQLVDRSLLTATDSGFAVRDPLLQNALVAWLRPSALSRLHRRIAEHALIPASERIVHWRGAGEPQLAQAAALEASSEAMSEGDYEHARPHLVQLSAVGSAPDAEPLDRLQVSEQLGDACAAMGRTEEALVAYGVSLDLAVAHHPPDVKRLAAKLQAATDTPLASPSERVPDGRPVRELSSLTRSLGISRQTGPEPAVEHALAQALAAADAGPDTDLQAELRSLLSWTVSIPRRQFRAVHRLTTEALERSSDPSLQARALVATWLSGALLGNGAAAEAPLRAAARLAADGGDGVAGRYIAALRYLVAHDLGRADVDQLSVEAEDAGAFAGDSDLSWVRLRVATERGHRVADDTTHRVMVSPHSGPVLRQLAALAAAAAATERGDQSRARELLLSIVDVADQTGTTLLVPEAAARLVVLEADPDPAGARERFELFEWAVGGDRLLPRENVLRHLARAAVRAADGRPDDAATAAAAAAHAAESEGLVVLTGECHRHRAVHLAGAGRRSESRLAAAAARRCYELAGIPGMVDRVEDDLRHARTRASAPVQRIPALDDVRHV